MSAGTKSLFHVFHQYLDVILPPTDEMKILLVDATTLHIISMAVSQAELLQRNVLLVDEVSRIDHRSPTKLLRCIFFLRPDNQSVSLACEELEKGRYRSYSIVFCAAASPDILHGLAYADAYHLVDNVQEIFCDFCVVNEDAFFIESTRNSAGTSFFGGIGREFLDDAGGGEEQNAMRIAEGLACVMAACKCVPLIRYDAQSERSSSVASELAEILRNDLELFHFSSCDTVLMIVDRTVDPLTPLITPWTYQAMLHEHFGVGHNIIKLPAELDPNGDLMERRDGKSGDGATSSFESPDHDIVVSCKDDALFAENMFRPWGEVCVRLKDAVDRCKQVVSVDRSSLSVEDLQVLVQSVPQNRSMTLSATKHVTLASLMANIIKKTSLLEISLLEQDMYANSSATEHWNRLVALSNRLGVDPQHILRLCMMYYLRYECNHNSNGDTSSRLSGYGNGRGSGISKTKVLLDQLSGGDHYQRITELRRFYGEKNSTDRLYPSSSATSLVQTMFSHLQKEETQKNVYAQHEPYIKQLLLETLAGRLNENKYRIAGGSAKQYSTTQRVKNVWFFVCGGYTFTEAALIHDVNEGNVRWTGPLSDAVNGKPISCIIGGDEILNASTFLNNLSRY